jgi:TolB-like protein/Tfp pilus assembly protein PilF
MTGPTPIAPRLVRFGQFEFDLRSGELRRQGVKIRLEGQPVQVLIKLLEQPGEIVTREALRNQLWPADTFVNFEQSLNAAVKRLRQALADSPQNPRFVETLARRGYRFIAPVHGMAGPAEPVAEAPSIHSLAVLPFENSDGDPEAEYLSDGITESIINSLSRLDSVRVMARSTVFQYKAKGLNPREVGRNLNVQSVLVGRVGQRADALVVGVELVEVRNGWQLWGEQYNRRLSDIFAVEEEISREISGKLRLHLSGEERNRLSKRYTESPAAYQDYLKGRYHLNHVTEEGLRQAIECFQQAIQKDPHYALAYTGLADSYGLLVFFGLAAPAEVMPKAREAARQAVTIDDGLAEAHASLAGILKVYDWDWAASEREYRRALELDPHHAAAHRMYAAFLAAMDRPAEAMREIERAHELDPLSLVISMEIAWNLYMARDYARSIQQAARTLDLAPEFLPAQHVLGLALQHVGRNEEAAVAFEKARAGSKDNACSLGALGHLMAHSGRASEAESILSQLIEMSRHEYVSAYWPAVVYAGLGRVHEALDWLENACRQHDLWLVWLKTEPRFDGLRGEERFDELLLQVGLLPRLGRRAAP